MAELNYWWVTRPKRKLNSIPEVLAAFSNVALEARWTARRDVHIMFEEELERAGLKRVGERRDHSGSGGRTYQAWLSCLGLIFIQERTGIPYLTLAGEAILSGKSPVAVLKDQVLKYQFPSAFSIKTHVSSKYKIHPFVFLLRLMMDSRIEYLTEEEIAKVAMTEAVDESNQCFERVVQLILSFREYGDASLPADFIDNHLPSTGRVNPEHPFSHLTDTANTMMNWLEYTQLIKREEKRMSILPERREEVSHIIEKKMPFIARPEEHEFFQRRYGLDPWHQKDTRNLINTETVSSRMIDMQRIRQAFIAQSIHRPIARIDADLISEIANITGTEKFLVETVLWKEYPYGAVGGFLSGYYEMAFKGRERECVAWPELGMEALYRIKVEGYQAIIDNKAYSEYSISGDHHNRMVHNYIENVANYSSCEYPIGFFTYIAGGFISTIDKQIQSEVDECHVPGSAITVTNIIKFVLYNIITIF